MPAAEKTHGDIDQDSYGLGQIDIQACIAVSDHHRPEIASVGDEDDEPESDQTSECRAFVAECPRSVKPIAHGETNRVTEQICLDIAKFQVVQSNEYAEQSENGVEGPHDSESS